MREQAQRMTRLVDDLLSLSRIEQNLHLRPQAPVDIASILRHISDTLAPVAGDNDVVLKLDVPDKAIVTGDRDELLRVAENLVENAIKYGASDPRSTSRQVEITLRAEPRQYVLSVRDYGPGIAAEHLPRLTERFYRVDAARAGPRAAPGLVSRSSNISSRAITARLGIESKLGEGTTFKVSLPLRGD